MGPLRRWKPLIAIVALWLLICYFFLADDSLETRRPLSQDATYTQPKAGKGGSHDGKVRWRKTAPRYPVESPRSLPRDKPYAEIPRIQKYPVPEESKDARAVRLQRLAAVKESFEHSWAGYKEHAWLRDEVAPLSGEAKDPFGGWAATLVDTLDTLWIMGMKKEFEDAVRAAEGIDFTYTEAKAINVFETTIRYMGGFLAAYELSEKRYAGLLNKAVEVAELLMGAFDTPNHMPISRWDWADYMEGTKQIAPNSVLVAEIGSLCLEFTKLSQLTGDMKYYDIVQRIADEFEKSQHSTKLPGMWPVVADAQKISFTQDSLFTLGGMSDSLYEYFPKQYLILGGTLLQPRKMYEDFIDVAKKHLFRRALNENDTPLLISGEARAYTYSTGGSVQTAAKGQHLTCFTGGMVGLAAKIFNRPDDLDIAAQLTNGCVWSYNITESGVGPEIFTFVPCGQIEDLQTGQRCKYTKEKWHEAVQQHWNPTQGTGPAPEDVILDTIKRHQLPTGMVGVNDPKYILRPEAIESVFMMYRLTGDAAWQDKAWTMFANIERHTRSGIASASLRDVTVENPVQFDSMESFWLAETLKYFYLVFADFDVVDLDRWVLNTEAHPLARPDV